MSIKTLFLAAVFGGLLLPAAASAGVVKTMSCKPGTTLKIAGTKVWCQGSSSEWKPSGPPKCKSGAKLDVRQGADKCKTPVVSKKPTCDKGQTYMVREGKDRCRTPPIGGPSKMLDAKCWYVINGIPKPGIYRVGAGQDKCEKLGGGKVSSLPAGACMTGMVLRADMVGQADRCAYKATSATKYAVTLQ